MLLCWVGRKIWLKGEKQTPLLPPALNVQCLLPSICHTVASLIVCSTMTLCNDPDIIDSYNNCSLSMLLLRWSQNPHSVESVRLKFYFKDIFYLCIHLRRFLYKTSASMHSIYFIYCLGYRVLREVCHNDIHVCEFISPTCTRSWINRSYWIKTAEVTD
jgi:hypothetical protein